MMRRASTWILGIGLLCVSAAAHDPVSATITWDGEISGIVERRCVSCHAPDGFGPFSLATYEDARPRAAAMKAVALAGEMPPWGATHGVGHFANDRRLTRHEVELMAAWADGGARRMLPALQSRLLSALQMTGMRPDPVPAVAASAASADDPGTLVPLANAVITEAVERAASVTLQVPAGIALTRWSFEPGTPAIIERVDLELGALWLGAWTAGDGPIAYPAGTAVPLPTSARFTARIAYREPAERTVDYSRLRIWIDREATPKPLREGTIVRSWRTAEPVELFGLRPAREGARIEVVARFANGRVEPIGAFAPPGRLPHPTYLLARPLSLPAGARVETTGPVRLLYTAGPTRTANANVSTRPPR